MKKDIPFFPVEGVMVAVARIKNELDAFQWNVYIINKNDFQITNVLVSSRGYGEKDGVKQETSILRHALGDLEPQSFAIIEQIDPAVFHLYNEYWVSYYINNQIFDKKFIFVPESITEANLYHINHLNLEGILHA